jgi:hypothetical protein
MAGIGYRPHGSDGPLYSPERDYAYITPTLMRQAIEHMESPEMGWWREQHNISAQEIVTVVDALAKAQRDFVNGADPVKTFEQALARYGFYETSPAVQQLLFASIGVVFCAAWFLGVREVSVIGEESPAQNDMARFAAAVRDFAERVGRPLYSAEYLAERLQFRNDVLQTRINMLGEELRNLRDELTRCHNTLQAERAAKPKTWWQRFTGK